MQLTELVIKSIGLSSLIYLMWVGSIPGPVLRSQIRLLSLSGVKKAQNGTIGFDRLSLDNQSSLAQPELEFSARLILTPLNFI